MNGLSDIRLTLQPGELTRCAHDVQVRSPQPASRAHGFWRRLQTRKALMTLTDEQLQDIGLSRDEARHEALRPFWTLW
jgi:uncharacterized protein YjiS (DUF1127 family)